MPVPPQLALPFPHQPSYRADELLHAPSNEAAIAWLDRTWDWPGGQLALWGQAGCGKTHLLHVWATRAGAALLQPPLPDSGFQRPAVAMALDDADRCAEQPLLHTLNAAREANLPVLLAARLPPARWPVRLPDLTSRLRAITAVEIGPLEEPLLRALLMRLLAERQLAVQPSLQEWLLLRLPRTPGAVRAAVERIERALAAGARINRPLLAATLADLMAEVEKAPADT